MKQSRTKIASTIASKTLKNGVSNAYNRQVAAYLLSERRVNELSSLMRDVQTDWEVAGYLEVLASCAHPLSPELKQLIIKSVKQLHPESQRIVVTEIYDPEIIGGVRLNLANQQLDLSVEAKLNKFKQLITAEKES